jgi:hypothetical protein
MLFLVSLIVNSMLSECRLFRSKFFKQHDNEQTVCPDQLGNSRYVIIYCNSCNCWINYLTLVFFTALSFVDNLEPGELLQLRIQMMLDNGCDEEACNLIGWCIRGQQLGRDRALIVKRYDLLTKLGRVDDIGKQVAMF